MTLTWTGSAITRPAQLAVDRAASLALPELTQY